MSHILPSDYQDSLVEIKTKIHEAQYRALKAVNIELTTLYWDIGKIIVERQKASGWGKAVVETLAGDLQVEFPGIQGFSSQNVWKMKQFYEAYVGHEKLSPLVREISWTKNIIIIAGCKDILEREFYIRMTKRFGWSKNVLIHKIEGKTYEKTITSQNNFNTTVPEEIRNQAKLAVKDEYTFDFLELGEDHSEREFEQSILPNVSHFLVEMGGVFTFVGNQYRLKISDKEFFIDILLYHRRLKCLVALELKIGEFKPEYVGKMQFYLAALDDRVKMPDENPSIGIILCKSKDKTIVEYALKESNKPIGVASYQIVTQLPENLKKELPNAEQIACLLNEI